MARAGVCRPEPIVRRESLKRIDDDIDILKAYSKDTRRA